MPGDERSHDAVAVAPGLVRCVIDGDWQGWEMLWGETPCQRITFAAVIGLASHLLARVAELSGGDRDAVLAEFALRLAHLAPPGTGPAA